jgi:hypothetical protein
MVSATKGFAEKLLTFVLFVPALLKSGEVVMIILPGLLQEVFQLPHLFGLGCEGVLQILCVCSR